MAEDDALTIWTIHRVARPEGFHVHSTLVFSGGRIQPSGTSLWAPTLGAARELVPDGLYRLERSPDDDPSVVETWI